MFGVFFGLVCFLFFFLPYRCNLWSRKQISTVCQTLQIISQLLITKNHQLNSITKTKLSWIEATSLLMRKWIQSLPTVTWAAAALAPQPQRRRLVGKQWPHSANWNPLALLVPVLNGAAPWPDWRVQVGSGTRPNPGAKGSLRDLWCCLQRDRENACWWERMRLHHRVKLPPLVVWCEEFGWPARCPPLLNQGVCVCNTCQPPPFPLSRQPAPTPLCS